MAKQEQILNIDPLQELKFTGPFDAISSTYLKLSNPTENHVLFKIKTTAPKKYCVRPNSGTVEPNGVIHVQVCLQAFNFDPNEKNKHKFMVQTLLWNPRGDLTQDEAWKEAKPENLMDTKLKCVFELPTTESGTIKKATAPVSEGTPVGGNETTRYISGDSPNNEEFIAKTRKEMMDQLMDEESNLREENQALKEEIRLMRAKMNSVQLSTNWSPIQAQQGFPPSMIVFAIIAGLVGLFLGKFLL